MKRSLVLAAILAISVVACSKKEETTTTTTTPSTAPAPAPAPAPETTAPAPATPVAPADQAAPAAPAAPADATAPAPSTSANILANIDCSRLQHVIAAHLSKQNNTPELARKSLAGSLNCELDWIGIADQEQGFAWRQIT